MIMNLLISSLPMTVTIDGAEYPINTDFRASILFEQFMLSGCKDEFELIKKTLETYYSVIPNNISEAVNKAVWFYHCGQSETNESKTGGKQKRIYSFEYDSEYIYAAFLDQYNIDLQEERIHWWKFKALFHALKDDNMISKIMGYRAVEINDKMSKEDKAFYRKMKKQYEIPISKTEKEKMDFVQEMLMKGNLPKVL